MDPETLNHVDWRSTSHLLRWLIIIATLMLGFATHLTIAHGLIPSLIASGHLPLGVRERVRKMRLPLYMSLIFILGGVAFFFFKAVESERFVRFIYNRDWI